jgi:putative PIN family toxin of toxin-antitoxin system
VFDTNVIVSALLFESSTPAQAFFGASQRGTILFSEPSFLELHAVLKRPKFDRYLTAGEREAFLIALLAASSLVEIRQQFAACRDPDDDKFLEAVINGKAACWPRAIPTCWHFILFEACPSLRRLNS